jgi:type I restriction enzyme S subunit
MNVEELWKIPNNWAWTKLKDLGEVVAGGTPSTKEADLWGDTINWISPADLTGYSKKTIARGAKSLSQKGLKNSSAKLMPAGSIHFSSRAPIGYVVISSEPITTNQGFKSLVPAPGVFSEYVYYYLKGSKQLAEKRASGTTFLELSGKAFGLLPLPIPPLNEQRRIVAKIEELFSELDKGVESLKTAREQLKIYRQAVLKHAFEGKLTAQWREGNNKHDSWSETTLGSLLSYLTSGSRGWADYYSSEGDLFIRAQNLKYDRLELEDVAYVQLPDKSEGMRTRVEIGDLLITITGANVTKTGCVQHNLGKAYVSQHVALCRPIESVSTEFLYWYLIAETFGRKQLNELAYGAGKPGLNLNNIRSVKVSLPCLKEQKQIVLQIRNLLSIEDNLADSIDVELQRVELLRQSILKKAFSGQLVPQDPTDEPAAVLLDRIRAAKAAQPQAAKKPRQSKPPSAEYN